MVALSATEGFDLQRLKAHLASQLPEYARPIFVRVVPGIELTGTIKLNKQLYTRQAFNPDQSQDPLYYSERESNLFLPLTMDVFAQFQAGLKRL